MSTIANKAAPAAPQISTAQKLKVFAIGGMSGMIATTFVRILIFHLLIVYLFQVQPIDMVKVRIQILSGENPGVKYGPFGVAK